jgi:hypothetical protein
MPLAFSSSSDDDAVDDEFLRERHRRDAARRVQAPESQGRHRVQRRRRERDASDSDDGNEPPPAPLPRGVTVGTWVPRRAGAIYHVAKSVYIPILNAQHHASAYFGEPNRKVQHRAYVDPSTVSLRCVDDGNSSYLPANSDDWLRLPIVLLSKAVVRGFYLAVDDSTPHAPTVPAEGAVHHICRTPSHEEMMFTRRIPSQATAAASGLKHAASHTNTHVSSADVVEEAFAGPDANTDLRIISLGCSVPNHGDVAHRLVVVRPSYVTFSTLHSCSPPDDTNAPPVVVASTTSAFTRSCQAAYVFRDTVLMAQLQPPRFLDIVFQTELFAVGTRLGGPRHGPPPPLPTAMALSGSTSGEGAMSTTLSREALILQDERYLSIIDVAHMSGRQVTLSAASIGPTACVGQTVRGALGTDAAIVVAGTTRGAVYALVDDPRCKTGLPMVLSFGAHRDAPSGGIPNFHDGGVQDVFIQGAFGFLSVARTGGCRLWDLRMCSAQHSQTDSNCRPVVSFHQPSRVAVDGGCSVAQFERMIAICSRIGHVDLYCTRTGRHLGDVQHSALSRSSALSLVPFWSMEDGPSDASYRLFWTSMNRIALHSAAILK